MAAGRDEDVSMEVLLSSAMSSIVGRHMHYAVANITTTRLNEMVAKTVPLVLKASVPTLLKATPAIDSLAVLRCAELLPLFVAVHERVPGLLESMPRCKDYIRHLQAAARLSAVFAPRVLRRLIEAVNEEQGAMDE